MQDSSFGRKGVARVLLMLFGVVAIVLAMKPELVGRDGQPGFGAQQIMLVILGLTVVVVAILGRRALAAYRAAALILLNTLILLVFVEFAVIIFTRATTPSVESRAQNLSYQSSQSWFAGYWRELRDGVRAQYHPFVLWKNAPFTGSYINITKESRRYTPEAECRADAYRIFMFGGSTLWGWGSPDWETIPAHLQASLSKRIPSACVINFGQNAYISTQELIELIQQLQVGQIPDLALFYDGFNDVATACETGRVGIHSDPDGIAAKLESNRKPIKVRLLVEWLKTSYTFSLISRFANTGARKPRILPSHQLTRENTDVLAKAIVQTYSTNYRIVKALAETYNFKYSFFWQPDIHSGKILTQEEQKILTQEEQRMASVSKISDCRPLLKIVHQRIRELSSKFEHLHYLGDVFNKDNSLVFTDLVHITPDGNKVIAREILDLLRPQLRINPGNSYR